MRKAGERACKQDKASSHCLPALRSCRSHRRSPGIDSSSSFANSILQDIDDLIDEFTQVTWLVLLLYHTDWVVSIAFTVFMRLTHLNHLSEFIYPLMPMTGMDSRFADLKEEIKLPRTDAIARGFQDVEFDLNSLKKISSEYAEAQNIAIKEASIVVDVQNIRHVAENQELIGDAVKIADDLHVQKETFYKQTGLGNDEGYGQVLETTTRPTAR